MNFVGSFYGYREQAALVLRPPRMRPRDSMVAMKLSPVIVEAMGVPGFDYYASHGNAPVNFPAAWIVLRPGSDPPWACRMAGWMLRGGPLEIQVSFDGVTVGEQRVLRASTTTLDSFVAYRVRQLVPGFAVWYQLIAIQ